jgi:hypothetical protein
MVAMKTSRLASKRRLPVQYPGPARPAETSAVRDQVTHDKYGLGVVLGVEDDAVLADFSPHRRRIPLLLVAGHAPRSETNFEPARSSPSHGQIPGNPAPGSPGHISLGNREAQGSATSAGESGS